MIKNKNYREFLDKGTINTITQPQLDKALKNIKGKNVTEARNLLITLYYTGARPSEVLLLKAKDIQKDKTYIVIQLHPTKGGLPRKFYLQRSNKHAEELYNYSKKIFPEQTMFYHFKNKYHRKRPNKKGETKETTETTDKIRYHLKKWFTGVIEESITPYFLRHNRFSKLAEIGATLEEIRILKGSRSMMGVTPYMHLTTTTAKKLAKKIL